MKPRRIEKPESRQKQAQNEQLAPVYATLAEYTLYDPAFRAADNSLYGTSKQDMTVKPLVAAAHYDANEAARSVMFDALLDTRYDSADVQRWEMARVATLKELSGTALGAFSGYFTGLQGEMTSMGKTVEDLPAGEYEVIKTNERVLSAGRHYDDPVEFLDMSLGAILRRKNQDRFSIGPENYSTAIKIFADKYRDLDDPLSEVSKNDINELMTDALSGLVDVARRDEPNVVEMTNIYYAVRTLPKESVDQKFTKPLLEYTLKNLHDFSPKTVGVFLGALPKLDISEHGDAAASLVNLALRKSKTFGNTTELKTALRAIESLSKVPAAEQAFRSFIEYRNDLENALDIDGADEVVYRLKQIVENVIDSTDLTVQAKGLADIAARKAFALTKRYLLDGSLPKEQQANVMNTMARIKATYAAI